MFQVGYYGRSWRFSSAHDGSPTVFAFDRMFRSPGIAQYKTPGPFGDSEVGIAGSDVDVIGVYKSLSQAPDTRIATTDSPELIKILDRLRDATQPEQLPFDVTYNAHSLMFRANREGHLGTSFMDPSDIPALLGLISLKRDFCNNTLKKILSREHLPDRLRAFGAQVETLSDFIRFHDEFLIYQMYKETRKGIGPKSTMSVKDLQQELAFKASYCLGNFFADDKNIHQWQVTPSNGRPRPLAREDLLGKELEFTFGSQKTLIQNGIPTPIGVPLFRIYPFWMAYSIYSTMVGLSLGDTNYRTARESILSGFDGALSRNYSWMV